MSNQSNESNENDVTIRQIAEEEGVSKHAISERMDKIPNFDKKYTHLGIRNSQRCKLINQEGANLLRRKSFSYRSISHGKYNSRINKNDSYRLRVEKASHELEEVKTGRHMLQNQLHISQQRYIDAKKSLADISNDRNHWRDVASSAQAQNIRDNAKDKRMMSMALKSQATSYKLKQNNRELPDNNTKSLKSENAQLKSQVNKLSKKHKSFWHKFF